MRAVTIEEFGDPSGMEVTEVPTPTPAPGHLAVTTEAIAVGGVDAVIRRGTLGATYAPGLVLGSEVAGVVTSTGAGVDSSWIGRRVWAFTGTCGGYAEHAVAHGDDVTPLPDGLSSIEAVTLGSPATVAHFALAHAHVGACDSLLVRGAAGSIGIAAVELAARAGTKSVAVTTSSPDRGRRLLELGATHVLDRNGAGDASAPEQFDVVIDIVAGADMPAFLERLAPNGRMVMVGAVAGFPPAEFGMSLIREFQQSRSFATFSLATVPVEDRNTVRAGLFEIAMRHEISPVIHAVLPLDQAAEAHRRMDRGNVFGRIVLVPGQ